MKKILLTIISILFIGYTFAAIDGYSVDKITSIQGDDNDVVNTTLVTTDPLREGTSNPGTKLRNTINLPVYTTFQAKNETLNLIKGIINYALGLLGLIALIYILVHGFMIVTAAGNDEKYKKGFQGIKYGSIALIGIGISWFIVSLILYLINEIAFK